MALSDALSNLSDRERRLVTLLGATFVAMVVIVPAALVITSISDLETENEELAGLITRIDEDEADLVQQLHRRSASATRFENDPPNLAAYVEAKAGSENIGLQIANTTPQNVSPSGDFRRERVRVTLNGVNMRPFIDLMYEILTDDFPISVTKLQIDKNRAADSYRIVFDLTSYAKPQRADRADTEGDESSEGESDDNANTPQEGRAGPPDPE